MTATPEARYLGWFGMVRLGLVQAALGAIIVLTTSTINRVMAVELALPAMVPGLLVGLHYAVQMSRPRMGHGSDVGRRRTPWILGGMAVLALGGALAAAATAWMATDPTGGLLLAVLAFAMIGVGVGASGTSLLVLMAKAVAPDRRAAAATTAYILMIVGFIVTAGTAGHFLDPFSTARLVAVTSAVSAIAMAVTVLAVWGIERPAAPASGPAVERPAFREALRNVWAEPQARGFAVFVFVSMLAFSAQDLILEPFAGTVFGLTPGESTKLSGTQHSGVLLGMILVPLAGRLARGSKAASLRAWTVGGCIASAMALANIGLGGLIGAPWPLQASVFALGVANGAFGVAAIGSMMERVGAGPEEREGVRMGVWGAAHAMAFGLGGVLGTVSVDVARLALGSPALAYSTVFVAEGLLFGAAALLAMRLDRRTDGVGRKAFAMGDRDMVGV